MKKIVSPNNYSSYVKFTLFLVGQSTGFHSVKVCFFAIDGM